MDSTFDKTAMETIELLEARLRRIEFALGGDAAQNGEAALQDGDFEKQQQPVSVRLGQLEHSLHALASKSKAVQDLLRLHARYPDLFHSIPPSDLPTTLDHSALLSIILASASSYPTTASRLTSIRDTPIPPAELSAELISLQPRIAKVGVVQDAQDSEIRDLRERSAVLLERWYKRGVVAAGEEWAQLEGRVRSVEVGLRRAERERREDEEGL